ncbi:hypothetical protein, partial [Bifidobacterium saguini]|uniref:hypothetical protein n=1 Tax=Bifidobacterium saguini TaxID=762210 RepID=UPI00186BC1B0
MTVCERVDDGIPAYRYTGILARGCRHRAKQSVVVIAIVYSGAAVAAAVASVEVGSCGGAGRARAGAGVGSGGAGAAVAGVGVRVLAARSLRRVGTAGLRLLRGRGR